jgi:hypothetical protein
VRASLLRDCPCFAPLACVAVSACSVGLAARRIVVPTRYTACA